MQQYKVLGAMLALGEFTVPQLEKASGAPEASVRTVLSRNKVYVEKLAKAEAGCRGGQLYVYRLLPEGSARIREKLSDLYPHIATGTNAPMHAPAEANDEARYSLMAVRRAWTKLQRALNPEEVYTGYRRLRQTLGNAAADLRTDFPALATELVPSPPQMEYEAHRELADSLGAKIMEGLVANDTGSALAPDVMAEIKTLAASALTPQHKSDPNLIEDVEAALRSRGVEILDLNETCFIVQAIPEPDSLTPWVTRLLRQANSYFGQYHNVMRPLRAYITMDSDNPRSRVPALDTIDYLSPYKAVSTVVLDAHYDIDVRNRVMRANYQYEGNAVDLTDDAIMSIACP